MKFKRVLGYVKLDNWPIKLIIVIISKKLNETAQ